MQGQKSMSKQAENFVFISGATGGIGRAFAYECAKEGTALFLTGRSEEKLALLRGELLQKFPHLTIDFRACDLADEQDRMALFGAVEQKGYRISRLCNVAGIDTQKPFGKYTQEKIVRQCRVNFEAAVSLAKFALERRADTLEIVTIASISGVYPMPYFALYSATKRALTQFFTALRVEMRGKGVRVTTIEPGGVYTRPDIVRNIAGQGLWGRLSAKTPEYIARKSLSAVRKNKRLLRPGFWNKFIATVPRVVPLSLRLRFIARRWGKLENDAF